MTIIIFSSVFLFFILGSYRNIQKKRDEQIQAGDFEEIIPLKEKIKISFDFVFKHLKTIVILIVVLYFGFLFYKKINVLNTFIENQNKIKNLSSVIKQLSKRYKVAEIEVLEIKDNTTTLRIYFFNNESKVVKQQIINIDGIDIYFDAIVLNFEYSKIETGGKNIVLPLCVYSEKVPKSEAVVLNLYSNNIPCLYERKENEIYGMEKKDFDKSIKEIVSFIKDKEKARKAGVRSIYGNGIHRRVLNGTKYIIWIEQTGGLVIKKKEVF